ncbi:hypothetical protein [Nocardia carnea]|uniref:hypothetical protein n=1 Tax=Nocardia carnea TaxID=37328 RepID=UPI002457E4AA|nr:hypothetical protein [Nocardia carnea]
MSNFDCQPIVTPDDCRPYGSFDPEAPATPAPAPVGDPMPETSPVTPPIEHLGDIDLPGLPDLSVITDAAGRSAVIAAVVIAVLIMTVAVAAQRPVEPHRLRNFATAAFVLPLASVAAGGAWATPWVLLWSGAGELAGADFTGLAPMLLVALPAGMLAATYVWANFLHKTNTVGLKSLGRTERVQHALTQRRARAAERAAHSGAPLHTGSSIVLGTLADHGSATPLGLWRELSARHQPWLTIPYRDAKKAQALFGASGSGKTELIKRYAVALFDYEYRAWHRWKDVPGMAGKHPKPQLVLITCKGGEDDRVLGREITEAMLTLGIPREEIGLVGTGAGGETLDIFKGMPARDLRAIIGDLLTAGAESTTSEGAHFEGIQKRIASLVVDAPVGPPTSTTEFLERLNPDKLKDIWGNAPDVVRQVDAMRSEKVDQLSDALIKCSNLFEQLKDPDGTVVFDGGKKIDDLSVLFMTVPALDKDAARAQVAATLRMVMQRAGRTAKEHRRSVTIFLDEASALTTKKGAIGLEDITERGRSQGVSMIFSGQSPESLASDSWSLNRLLNGCAGGVLLGYCEQVGDLCKHFGSVRSMLPSRHLIKGQRTGDEGQVSVGDKWLVDPDRVRQFNTGDFVFAMKGHAWFGRIVRVDLKTLKPLPGTTADPAVAHVTGDIAPSPA